MSSASSKDAMTRGTLRALSVLRALNEHNGSTVSHLSHVTGIPRPSLYRILSTLCNAGYLSRPPGEERYYLTLLVRGLSEGFDDDAWIREIAFPALHDLQRAIVWPVDLACVFGDTMCIRETTRRNSPLTNEHRTVGYRVPMLISASGRAYLAFCPAAEREIILDALARSPTPENALAQDRVMVANILRETRRNGYGQRYREHYADTGSIAVPIMLGNSVLACIHVAFFANSSTPREVAARHLGAIKESARQIQEQLRISAFQPSCQTVAATHH